MGFVLNGAFLLCQPVDVNGRTYYNIFIACGSESFTVFSNTELSYTVGEVVSLPVTVKLSYGDIQYRLDTARYNALKAEA